MLEECPNFNQQTQLYKQYLLHYSQNTKSQMFVG